ncbi:hypothetical protein JJJ17_02095 [Paracoccus caeni]|uniref:Uncharacterized protein n=1 Tax=Paracoccus caeni TaxID=657651 RepID=A0A934VYF9_9RHOB|nr:hypothetical protein [Paracoccus caeni]
MLNALIQLKYKKNSRLDPCLLFDHLLETKTRISDVMNAVRELRDSNDACVLNLSLQEFLPQLLTILSRLEHEQHAQLSKQDVKQAVSMGKKIGRPIAMTQERAAWAQRLLRDGYTGVKIYPMVAQLEGPSLSRSAYYLWQKALLS